MSAFRANAEVFTPRRTKGHVRSASDPMPGTGTGTSRDCFSPDASDDGCEDRVDSVMGTSTPDSSHDSSPSAPTSNASIPVNAHYKRHALAPVAGPAQAHFPAPKKAPTRDYAKVAAHIRALGPQAAVYAMPNIKLSHDRLRIAQSFFPPEMCVFVGNLPAHWDDGMLTRAVKYEFGRFGPCTVGVFRKTYTKPYAIVQYTDLYDAYFAQKNGDGLWMERYLRVEFSARARTPRRF